MLVIGNTIKIIGSTFEASFSRYFLQLWDYCFTETAQDKFQLDSECSEIRFCQN